MVERPIKKSECQPKPNTDNNSENLDLPPVESKPQISKPSVNKSSGKERKASFGDENKQRSNPALARGPKPVKPPTNIKPEPETESEPISDEPEN